MDINKEFEKLAEEFEKEWHDGHEPQGEHDHYEEEEIEEAFSMRDGDKRVVDAFYDKKTIKQHGNSILTSDGKTLTKVGMGGQDIAKWENGKIKIVAKMDVKSTEQIVRYMKKSIPKINFKEDWKPIEEAFWKVNIPDMPPVFIEAGSASEIKSDMRKKLKGEVFKELGVERVSKTEMIKKYRSLAKGGDDKDFDTAEARTYLDREDERKKKKSGKIPQSQKKSRWGSGGYGKGEGVEESEEDEAYGGTKKWKKGQNKMKKAGIALHKKDKFSGYVEDADIEEGIKDLPPHLQKLIKKIEQKQKDWNKKYPDAQIKTLVYNPETGKPDIIVKETTMKLEDTVKSVLEGKLPPALQKAIDKKKGKKDDEQDEGTLPPALQKAIDKKKGKKDDSEVKEDSDKDKPGTQGDMKKYQAARAKVMKKFGVKSCSELEGDEKKACYSALDAAHVSDDEEEKGEKKEQKSFSKMFSHIKSLMQGK